MAGVGPSTRTIAKVFLTVVALAAALYFVYRIRTVLGLLAISVFLAVALGPAVEFFVRHGLGRARSIVVTYLLILSVVVGIGLLVVPPIVNQVNAFVRHVPHYVDDLRKNKTFRKYDRRYHISRKLEDQAKKLPSRLGDAVGALQSVTVGVFGAIVQLVTVLTMTFFLLRDGGTVFDFLVRLLRPKREEQVRSVARDVYGAVSGYVAGNLLISLIAGTVTWITLEILGVPFAVPLAVLMAFLDLIPLVGATIGAIAIGIVTAFSNFPTDTIVWAIVAVVYQQVENNVIQPVVYRRTVNVHPLIVIVAILIGATLLGVLGALLAIPVAAAVQIIILDAWTRRGGTDDLVLVQEGETGPEIVQR